MEPYRQREQDIEKQISEDYKLQCKLEEDLRYADNPKAKGKLEKDINEIKNKISERNKELDEIRDKIKKQEALAREMPAVTFDELDVVTKFILGMQPRSSEISFTITGIREKMLKNHLTEEVRSLLTMGMGKAREVGQFVEHNALLRPEFPEKLKAGFLTEYQRLSTRGIKGDELFECLHKFSSGYSSDFKRKAAGLAVLSYLFEKCEVFER